MDILEGLYDLGMTSVSTVFQIAVEKAIKNTIVPALNSIAFYIFLGFLALLITTIIIGVIRNNRLDTINGKLTDEIKELKKMNETLIACNENMYTMARLVRDGHSPYHGEPKPPCSELSLPDDYV